MHALTMDKLKNMQPEAIRYLQFKNSNTKDIKVYVAHYYNEKRTELMKAIKERFAC